MACWRVVYARISPGYNGGEPHRLGHDSSERRIEWQNHSLRTLTEAIPMPASDRALDALLADYTEAREDERYFSALQGTVIALALTGVSLLGALANEVAGGEGSGKEVPDPLVAGAPLIILCILAFGQAAGALAV